MSRKWDAGGSRRAGQRDASTASRRPWRLRGDGGAGPRLAGERGRGWLTWGTGAARRGAARPLWGGEGVGEGSAQRGLETPRRMLAFLSRGPGGGGLDRRWSVSAQPPATAPAGGSAFPRRLAGPAVRPGRGGRLLPGEASGDTPESDPAVLTLGWNQCGFY